MSLALREIIKNEGMSALFRGLTPTTLASTLNWGCYFAVYEYTKAWWYCHMSAVTSTYFTFE